MPQRAWLLLALGLIAVVFFLLRLWQRRQPPPSAELVRKAAHISTGLISATFPWLFHSTWPVLTLCGLALLGMICLRAVPLLRSTVGRVTGSVERRSWGEIYFPLAVGCVWILSHHNPVLYVIPILLLTFGDAAAALVGTGFGRHKFRTTEGTKSLEGSFAFLVIGCVATLATLMLLAPDMDWVRAMLIALLLAGLLMAFEAIAWRGLDNLLVPVLAFALLQHYLKLDLAELATRIVAFSIALALLVVLRGRRTLIGEGLVAVAIFLYGAWALGGWSWLAPPATVILIAPWLPRSSAVPHATIHGVFPVLALSASGLLLLLVHTLSALDVWTSYVATFSIALTVIAIIQLHADLERFPLIRVFGCALLLGVPLAVIPPVIIAGLSLPATGVLLAIAALSSMLACGVGFAPALNRLGGDTWIWLLRGIAVWLGSAVAFALSTFLPRLA